MALMRPKNPKFPHQSEKLVFDYIKNNLPNEYVAYYNYNVDIREFDFCLFVPYKGVLIIEVKAWIADNIREILDNNFVSYKTREGVKKLQSPYKQAEEYSYRMIKELDKRVSGNVLVLPVVCYTNITESEYRKKRLDIISPKTFTIFKEDLENETIIESKIDEMFSRATLVYKKRTDYFDPEDMNKAREMFETREQINRTAGHRRKQGNRRPYFPKEYYSILQYIPREKVKDLDAIIDGLLKHWRAGTKLIIFTNDEKIRLSFNKKMKDLLYELGIGDKFSGNIYNYHIYLVNLDKDAGFKIFDGNTLQVFKQRKTLRLIDKQCNYNLKQYMVEHYTRDGNLVIKAGAGTGKTFTMISRIMFLIHNERMGPEDLVSKIYLITFTNEAADSMKEKLKQELMNYYIVTGDFNYFQMIDIIEDMKISTIHSLSIDILRKYCHHLGLGKDFSVVSGKYERNTNVIYALNSYIQDLDEEKKAEILEYDLNMYSIRKIIEGLMEKLEDKNIDVLNTRLALEDGKNKELNKLLSTVLLDAEIRTRKDLKENNSIKLSYLMIYLRKVLKILQKDSNVENIGPKYLFVDEFQDTDNTQIDLIKAFMDTFKFNLFVVGDIKQCIYRFRGAEENAFDQLTKGSKHRWRIFTLKKNYRTDKSLLHSFESIFEEWARADRLQYETKKDNLVSHIKLNNQKERFFKEIPIKTDNAEEFEEKLVDELNKRIEEIQQIIEEEKKGKRKAPKDKSIAILVRENREVDRILEIGRKYGILIESDRGGELYKLESTLDFYKLILALQNNRSPKHLYNLYDTSYVARNLPLKEIYLNKQDDKELVEYFYRDCPIKGWQYYLDELKKEPALKVLREIVLDIKPWRIYKEKHQLGASYANQYKRNLDLLFEKLTERSKTDYLTISNIEENLGIMIKTSQEAKARTYFQDQEDTITIKCMTVHKAKGLEFNTVILPFTNAKLAVDRSLGKFDFIIVDRESRNGFNVGYLLRKDNVDSSRDRFKSKFIRNRFYKEEESIERDFILKEETRILYVAMTRAIKNLTYFKYENIKEKECWQNFLGVGGE